MPQFPLHPSPQPPRSPSHWQSYRQAYGRMLTVMLLIVTLGFTTVGDYGISWDEGTEIASVKYSLEWIINKQPIPRDLKHYGLVFNGAAELVYQAKQWLTQPNYDPRAELQLEAGDRGVAQALRSRIRLKHRLTFLITLGAYSGVMILVALLAGVHNAWFAAVVLALMPRFWGHGFFNPKDIPFASVFTLATALGALLLNHYYRVMATSHSWTISQRRYHLGSWTAAYGVVVGLLTGIRVGGWVILGFIMVAHLGSGGLKILDYPLRLLRFYGPMLLGWALTTIAVYPASWLNPIHWFWHTNRYLSNHPWATEVLFQGDYYSARELPRSYLPVWLGITVPTIWLVAGLLSLILLVLNYRVLTPGQRAGAILVLLQGVGLPGVAIALHSPIYGGMRQFLFILPSLAAIAAWGLIWLYQQITGRWRRFAALSALVVCLSPIVFDMIRLHPQQSVYFNRLSGSLPAAYGQYDVDYWGLSLREGIDWLNENAENNATVAIGGPQYIAEVLARDDLQVLNLDEELGYGTIAQPDYFVSMVYLDLPNLFLHCPTVHQVKRQGVPLSIVKDCTNVEFIPASPLHSQ